MQKGKHNEASLNIQMQDKMKHYDLDASTTTLIKKSSCLLIRLANQHLKERGVPHAYTPFLMQLWETDGLIQAVLHRTIGVEQSTAVRTLNRMERDHFIVRQRSADDKREIQILLTAKARQLKEEVWQCAQKINGLVTTGLSQAEIVVLNKLLKTIINNAESELQLKGASKR